LVGWLKRKATFNQAGHLQTDSYYKDDLAGLLPGQAGRRQAHPHDHTKYEGEKQMDRIRWEGRRKRKHYKAPQCKSIGNRGEAIE